MWPLVFAAQERALESSEVAELRRLAELVKRGMTSRPGFNERADALYKSLAARVLATEGTAVGEVEEILDEIDDLRGILEA